MKTYLKQTIGLSVLCLVMIAGGYPVWAQTKQTAEQELPKAAINEDRVWKPRAVEIEVSTPDPLPVFNPPSNSYRKDLLTAMDYHNMANAVQNTLSETLMESNEKLDTFNNSRQTINLNGSYMFQDDESMDYLLNKIGLAVQRQGGQ